MCAPPQTGSEKDKSGILRRGTIFGATSVALLALSTTLTIPHLQSRRDELGCDTMCYGSLTSTRSFLSVLGAVIMGRLSDSAGPTGRKLCLIIGGVATLAGMIIAGNTYSIQGLWLSMIPGALLQQNFNVMKALLSDLNQQGAPAERASAAGMLGMAAGLAFMFGPLTGATILKTFEKANLVGMIFVIASLGIVSMIPNSPPVVASEGKSKNGFTNVFNVKAARTPGALLFMAIRTCMALAFHVFQTIWSVSLKTKFDFGPTDYGMFMSFIGLTYALSQGVLAKYLLETLGANKSDKVRVRMLMGCCVTLGLGRYIAFQTESLLFVYILFACIVTALGLVNTILTADTSYLASSDEIGSLFGILASVESGAGMVGPILGGALTYVYPIQAPLCTVIFLYATVYILVAWGYEGLVLAQRIPSHERKSL